MASNRSKPTSTGTRGQTHAPFENLTAKQGPGKALSRSKTKTGGQTSRGRITSRFIGATKRESLAIDFKRDKRGIPAKVVSIAFDPNRSADVALLHYVDGEKRYILAPNGLTVGRSVVAGEDADILVGNALPLAKIPLGTVIHNIELKEGKGGQLVRLAGAGARLVAREGDWATLHLPDGETRRVHTRCYATIGQVSYLDDEIRIAKAGHERPFGEKLQKRRDTILADMQRMIVSMIPESTVPLPSQVLQARRNAEARENLLQEFGAMKSSEIGDLAGSKASNRAALAHKWKSDRRIFSVVHGNVTYFPGFQFTPEGQPLQVIAEILAILGEIRKEWEVALWFTASNGWLKGARPVDLLLEAPQSVVEAARREAEERVF